MFQIDLKAFKIKKKRWELVGQWKAMVSILFETYHKLRDAIVI